MTSIVFDFGRKHGTNERVRDLRMPTSIHASNFDIFRLRLPWSNPRTLILCCLWIKKANLNKACEATAKLCSNRF